MVLDLRVQSPEEGDEHPLMLSCGAWLTLPFYLYIWPLPVHLFTEEHPVWIDEVIEADEVRILSRMVTHLITNLTEDSNYVDNALSQTVHLSSG